MKSKFDAYINKLDNRKEQFKRNTVKDNVFFGNQSKKQKIKKMDELLSHLKAYGQKTSALIQENPENKEFYENHFQAVVQLLENIDNKKPSELKNKDFQLIIPNDIQYNKTWLDILKEAGMFALGGTVIGGFVGAIIASIWGSLSPATILLPLFLLGMGACPASLGFFLMGIAVVLATVLIFAAIGFVVGLCIASYQNADAASIEYRDNLVLNSDLLKETYKLFNTGIGGMDINNSANEDIELDDTSAHNNILS